MKPASLNPVAATIAFLAIVALCATIAAAYSSGINGYSGDPATGGLNCNTCHSGGVVPTVTITGPTVVAQGSTHTYSLRISGGQQVAGGLDVSASEGSLTVSEPGTKLQGGEITHTFPRAADGAGEVSWTFRWTAPATSGTRTLYGSGNSVNLAAGTSGDRAASTTLNVTVTGPATPGETSGAPLAPLLVTGYEAASGNLSLSYQTGCETTSNNIYFGPLEQVSSYGWSGQDCNIGISGSYGNFNPGPGSWFFVVVGRKGADEGSYGKDRRPDGSSNERPPYGGNTCGQVQNLTNACTP